MTNPLTFLLTYLLTQYFDPLTQCFDLINQYFNLYFDPKRLLPDPIVDPVEAMRRLDASVGGAEGKGLDMATLLLYVCV